MPHIPARWRRAVAHGGDIAEEYRFTPTHTHHQIGQVLRVFEKWAGFYRHCAITRQQITHRHARIGRLQRAAQVGDSDTTSRHAGGIDLDHDGTAGTADGAHFAGAWDALQIGLHAMRHPLQVKSAGGLAEQRQPDDGHIIDAFGLYQRLLHAKTPWQPVCVRPHRVVQAHQRLDARHADLELHGDDGHAGLRHRHHMFGAGDLRKHLFGRRGDHLLDIPHRCARKRDENIDHGHVDLRLFFTRRHEHGKRAEQ